MKSETRSVVYSITQECPFKCDICLRYYVDGDKLMDQKSRKLMVDILKERGIRRITVTGASQ